MGSLFFTPGLWKELHSSFPFFYRGFCWTAFCQRRAFKRITNFTGLRLVEFEWFDFTVASCEKRGGVRSQIGYNPRGQGGGGGCKGFY